MKATGIVRRIDELGRVVIPKEIRRTQQIRMADPLEIFVGDEGEVVFKKFSVIGHLSPLVQQVAAALAKALHCGVLITDRDEVLCVADCDKTPQHTLLDGQYRMLMEQRVPYAAQGDDGLVAVGEKTPPCVSVMAPVVVNGDVTGSVAICARAVKTEKEPFTLTAACMAADILTKHLEM